jgi:hypothetical protein
MGGTIAKMPPLRKLEPYIVPAVVVLVGLSAFGLGRLSVIGEEGPRLTIHAPQAASVGAASGEPSSAKATESGRNYVASKSGSKYYLPTCSGAARIKEENKVWFDSAKDAEARGYSAASNCPGL